jgi:hypothetical protein
MEAIPLLAAKKCWSRTNALAYYAGTSLTTKKCFEILTADDEAHGICKFQLHQEQAGQSTFIFI